MERRIIWTERASSDIEAIVRYIARRDPDVDCRGANPNPPGQSGFFGSYETVCYPVNGGGGGNNFEHFQKPAQHGQSFNVLFCDSHVLSIKVIDLFDPKKTATSWNHDHQPHPEAWIPHN